MAKNEKKDEAKAPPAAPPSGDDSKPSRPVKAGSNEVALRAPKGTAQVGLPLDGDEVLRVVVPKSGIVRVSLDVAGRLQSEHGFTRIDEDDDKE